MDGMHSCGFDLEEACPWSRLEEACPWSRLRVPRPEGPNPDIFFIHGRPRLAADFLFFAEDTSWGPQEDSKIQHFVLQHPRWRAWATCSSRTCPPARSF